MHFALTADVRPLPKRRAIFGNGKSQNLRTSDEVFFNWQYDLRWAARRLRTAGQMKAAGLSPKGLWELASN